MTDSNTNPYAGSGQSPWQPEQAPAPSSESDSGVANPSGEAGSQQPNNTYPGGGSVPPQTPYNPYAQGGTPYGQQYNPNYSQPYAQQYGYMSPAANQQYNGFAIAGFVCSFFTSIIGLIFSIIGLNQIKRQGGKGKGLAIAGIIISVAKLGIYLLLIVMIIVGLFSGMVDAVTNDLRSDYSYSRYDDMDDQYDSYYYDDQYNYDDSGDIDIDDLDRALEQLNGVSEWSPAFTVYSPAVSISE
ncbi:DUF4190 domain-containing protein [Bifidobacterium breve]|uniref:DUF4190 domain-containing protein n=1 Tax=Bifidobacterium breve TaxID=1685 RepID=UPI0022AF3123|nr:DUF4190 domain-containing protein [Bifidobacterium breve]MCZ4444152.1 DUF4190 domain-containing protein [Bifidobacterium breve]MCZ4445940.1 DUF4190 domain-containing protein [Bifidobacterium breve]MCZ4453459.1 DUF4190 domain-containing protein [Bifidobacterium breve]